MKIEGAKSTLTLGKVRGFLNGIDAAIMLTPQVKPDDRMKYGGLICQLRNLITQHLSHMLFPNSPYTLDSLSGRIYLPAEAKKLFERLQNFRDVTVKRACKTLPFGDI